MSVSITLFGYLLTLHAFNTAHCHTTVTECVLFPLSTASFYGRLNVCSFLRMKLCCKIIHWGVVLFTFSLSLFFAFGLPFAQNCFYQTERQINWVHHLAPTLPTRINDEKLKQYIKKKKFPNLLALFFFFFFVFAARCRHNRNTPLSYAATAVVGYVRSQAVFVRRFDHISASPHP